MMASRKLSRRFASWVAGTLVVAASMARMAAAQHALVEQLADPAKNDGAGKAVAAVHQPTVPESGLVQTSCSSCGMGPGGGALCGPGAPGSGGCGTCCLPGRNYCCSDGSDCGDSGAGKLLGGFFRCICCPDPCYEPCWLAVADQGFFLDAARPVTQMRLRWDNAWRIENPDRAESIWARQRTNPNQLTPGGRPAGFGKGPAGITSFLDVQSLSLYMEAASGGFGFFIETPYEHLNPEAGLANATLGMAPPSGASGFGDLTLATKSMLLDCPLMQVTFQFKTFLPTGDFTKGLGTSHVSLEPSLLGNLCLSPNTYLQSQLAYWIPIGGDDLYQGNIFHLHLSLNRILFKPTTGIQVVGNIELNEWSILSGAYTLANVVSTSSPNSTTLVPVSYAARGDFLSVGPGVRVVFCDKIDLGIGSAFAVTQEHWAEQQIRVDFRWRF